MKWAADIPIVSISLVQPPFSRRHLRAAALYLSIREPGALATNTANISAGLYKISLFINIADVLGLAFTLLLVIFTSCVGISLMRNQGMRSFVQIQQKLSAGESPALEMMRSVSLVIAGFLLMIPGFFTDFLGLLLLLPPVQKLLRLMPHLSVYRFGGLGPGGNAATGNTFDGEFQRKGDERYMLEQRPDDHDKHNDR